MQNYRFRFIGGLKDGITEVSHVKLGRRIPAKIFNDLYQWEILKDGVIENRSKLYRKIKNWHSYSCELYVRDKEQSLKANQAENISIIVYRYVKDVKRLRCHAENDNGRCENVAVFSDKQIASFNYCTKHKDEYKSRNKANIGRPYWAGYCDVELLDQNGNHVEFLYQIQNGFLTECMYVQENVAGLESMPSEENIPENYFNRKRVDHTLDNLDIWFWGGELNMRGYLSCKLQGILGFERGHTHSRDSYEYAVFKKLGKCPESNFWQYELVSEERRYRCNDPQRCVRGVNENGSICKRHKNYRAKLALDQGKETE